MGAKFQALLLLAALVAVARAADLKRGPTHAEPGAFEARSLLAEANSTAPAPGPTLTTTNITANATTNSTAPAAGTADRKKGGGWWRGKGKWHWGDDSEDGSSDGSGSDDGSWDDSGDNSGDGNDGSWDDGSGDDGSSDGSGDDGSWDGSGDDGSSDGSGDDGSGDDGGWDGSGDGSGDDGSSGGGWDGSGDEGSDGGSSDGGDTTPTDPTNPTDPSGGDGSVIVPPTPPTDPTTPPVNPGAGGCPDIQAALDAHNAARTARGAAPLAWNDTLAQYAVGVSQTCKFEHSNGQYGENLAMGVATCKEAVDLWVAEQEQYDANSAAFDPNTGHFTQARTGEPRGMGVVWKATTQVGCGFACNIVTCSYDPAGNEEGQYATNV